MTTRTTASTGLSQVVWLTTEDSNVETGAKDEAGDPDPAAWQVWPTEFRAWLLRAQVLDWGAIAVQHDPSLADQVVGPPGDPAESLLNSGQ